MQSALRCAVVSMLVAVAVLQSSRYTTSKTHADIVRKISTLDYGCTETGLGPKMDVDVAVAVNEWTCEAHTQVGRTIHPFDMYQLVFNSSRNNFSDFGCIEMTISFTKGTENEVFATEVDQMGGTVVVRSLSTSPNLSSTVDLRDLPKVTFPRLFPDRRPPKVQPVCHFNAYNKKMMCYVFEPSRILEFEASPGLGEGGEFTVRSLAKPRYLQHDRIFSYTVREHDMILMMHPLNWFYRLNVTDLRTYNRTLVTAFHPILPANFSFVNFLHADEVGVAAAAWDMKGLLYVVYGIFFDDQAGLKMNCLYRHLRAPLAIFGRWHVTIPRPELLSSAHQHEEYAIVGRHVAPLFWLFLVVVVYVLLFLTLSFLPRPPDDLTHYMRLFERNLVRLAPVLQEVVFKEDAWRTKVVKKRGKKKVSAPEGFDVIPTVFSLPEFTGKPPSRSSQRKLAEKMGEEKQQ